MQILKQLFQFGGDLAGLTHTADSGGFHDCNSYVIQTKNEIVMFDCGCGETFDQIMANMRYWGLDPDKLSTCFITHAHWDHTGAAHILKERGIRLIAHAETARSMQAGDERCAGYLYHKEYMPCEVDTVVDDQQVIKVGNLKVQALYFPGHTMGCTAFALEWEGKQLVFSGDIIGTLGYDYFGWNGSYDFDKKVYIESLKQFAKMDFDVMLPGHGLIYFHKPKWRIEDALNHVLIQWR